VHVPTLGVPTVSLAAVLDNLHRPPAREVKVVAGTLGVGCVWCRQQQLLTDEAHDVVHDEVHDVDEPGEEPFVPGAGASSARAPTARLLEAVHLRERMVGLGFEVGPLESLRADHATVDLDTTAASTPPPKQQRAR
jgi:hypothetical protein